MYKAKELTQEEVKAIIASTEGIKKLAKQFSVGDERIQVIKKAASLEEAMKFAKGMVQAITTKPVGTPKEQEGGKFVTATAPQPAAVVFHLGKQDIELDPAALYESYLLYMDLRARQIVVKDSFSDCIKDGVGLIWRFLVNPPVFKDGKVINW